MKIVIINKSRSSQARNGCSADPVLTPTCVFKRSRGLLALFSCWALIETGRVIGGIIVCCRSHRRRSRFGCGQYPRSECTLLVVPPLYSMLKQGTLFYRFSLLVLVLGRAVWIAPCYDLSLPLTTARIGRATSIRNRR